MTLQKRADYLKDYDIVPGADGKQELVYHGIYYQFRVSGAQWTAYKRKLLSFGCLNLFLLCAASLLDPASLRGSGALYVSLPYIALFFPVILGLGRVLHLQKKVPKLERMDYDQCVTSLSLCTIAAIVIAAAAFLGQVLSLFLLPTVTLRDALAALCFLLVAASCWRSHLLQRAHPCDNIGKQTPTES